MLINELWDAKFSFIWNGFKILIKKKWYCYLSEILHRRNLQQNSKCFPIKQKSQKPSKAEMVALYNNPSI